MPEECAVVAVVLRRILWRRAARRNQTLHRAAGGTAIVVAYPGLQSWACATHWWLLLIAGVLVGELAPALRSIA